MKERQLCSEKEPSALLKTPSKAKIHKYLIFDNKPEKEEEDHKREHMMGYNESPVLIHV